MIRDWEKCGRGLAGTVSNHCVFSQYSTVLGWAAATHLREASRRQISDGPFEDNEGEDAWVLNRIPVFLGLKTRRGRPR